MNVNGMSLQMDSNGPDILGFERWLLTYQPSLVPRFTLLVGFHTGYGNMTPADGAKLPVQYALAGE